MKQLILHLCLLSTPLLAIAQAEDFPPLKPQEKIRHIQQRLLDIPPIPPMQEAIPNLKDKGQTLSNLPEIPIISELEYHFGFNHSFDFEEDVFKSIFNRQGWDELQQFELPEKKNNKFLEMLPFYQFFKS